MKVTNKTVNYTMGILLILIAILIFVLFFINDESTNISANKPKHHFYFIGQNQVDPYWKNIRKGIEDASNKYNVVFEYNSPRFTNSDEETMFLDIAISSNVDGIIANGVNTDKFTELIREAFYKQIPIITIENDNKNSKRSTFVGANSYLLGEEAGRLMAKATKGKANIAIIVNNDNNKNSINHNLRINGFLSIIKNYKNMEVVDIYTSELGILSAEEITQSIINDKNIDAIYTTNTVDTIGSAQLIVDLNKVEKIKLIGYGDTDEIARYIEKGIIYGTVMSDPYKIGYESVKTLLDIKENNRVTTFIDTGIEVITKENLSEYKDIIKVN
ncbi:substrate-binding domain-containing protein [Sporosalibacterium faouarense]|uniref:substrate-binding domain-containing protein n=1 Tax=Sporosalibacterium faouarense TaxID=516123 RepID=UPI00141C1A2A|nr:substrate-binding domain-containing protein [Sporosalibacterium faouarense]MTI47136.1 sugar ABC transporter substrate-binding protein [Bacillota bacterium]